MANKKRYIVDWDMQAQMEVEVDHDVMNEEALHNINIFWSEAEDRIEDEDGSVLNAVLKLLFNRCLHLQMEYGYTPEGLIRLFDYEKEGKGQEGWPKMDGSEGILIVNCDSIDIDPVNMTVSEKQS